MTGGAGLEGLRRALATPVGRAAGTVAYELVGTVAARWLAGTTEGASVFATGSFAQGGEALEPGRSDLDLVLVLPEGDLVRDRTFRDGAWPRVVQLRTATRIVQGLDYLESQDLPHLRRFGDAWSFGLSQRWRRMSGTLELGADPTRPPHETRLLHVAKLFRRWLKATPRLLAAEPSEAVARATRRLLADALDVAERRELGPRSPATERSLLVRAASLGIELGRDARARAPWSSPIVHRLAWATELLEAALAELRPGFATDLEGPRLAPPPRDDERLSSAVAGLVAFGCHTVVAPPRDAYGGDRLLLGVAPPEVSAFARIDAMARLARALPSLRHVGIRWTPHAVIVSPTMLRCLALLDRGAFLVDGARGEAATLHGAVEGRMGLPAPELRGILHRAELARALVSLRSRLFHERSWASADERLAYECDAVLASTLERGADGRIAFRCEGPAPRASDPLARAHTLLAEVRRALRDAPA